MNIKTIGRMYKEGNNVYIGTRQLHVKNQRGRLYVNYKSKQVNLKDIPISPLVESEYDYVFNYIFGGGFIDYPCPAMDYWIYRHRLGHKISIQNYISKFKINKK